MDYDSWKLDTPPRYDDSREAEDHDEDDDADPTGDPDDDEDA